jgi:hypothetical protein
MSNLLSTSVMIAKCQARVPIGLSQTFWMDKLNEAYRWISQKGAFVWDLEASSVSIPDGSTTIALPTGTKACDPGKPIYLAGPTSGSGAMVGVSMDTLIPSVPWDEALTQQFAEVEAPPGAYSCWAMTTSFTGTDDYRYKGYLYPFSARPIGGTFTMALVYHRDVSATELPISGAQFFPTPNSFDNLMIELAEAEARRIYGLAGWDIIQKRAESAIVNLLDPYRSTKNAASGLVDQQKQTAERQMMKQERT